MADRLPQDKPVIADRSRCDHCQHVLGPLDLIPVISFLLLRARCRYCHKKLSLLYPTIEIVTGLLAVVMWLFVSTHCGAVVQCVPYTVTLFIMLIGLLGLFFADLLYLILPDSLVILVTLAAVVIKIIPRVALLPILPTIDPDIVRSVLVGAGAASFFLLLVVLTKGKGMGIGDVKFAFFIGFLFGFPYGLVTLYVAFLTGGLVAAILILSARKRFGQIIAFGPFLIGATIAVLYWHWPFAVAIRYVFGIIV